MCKTVDNQTDTNISGSVKAAGESNLTESEWIDWFIRDLDIDSLSSGLSDHSKAVQLRESTLKRSKADFMKLSESTFLISRFSSLPSPLQRSISVHLASGTCVFLLEATVKLALEVCALQDSESFLDQKIGDMFDSLQDSMGTKYIYSYQKLLQDFVNFQEEDASVLRSCFLMLTLLHGGVVQDVTKIWMTSQSSPSLNKFIAIVKNWDKYSKLPIEWSVNVINDSTNWGRDD